MSTGQQRVSRVHQPANVTRFWPQAGQTSGRGMRTRPRAAKNSRTDVSTGNTINIRCLRSCGGSKRSASCITKQPILGGLRPPREHPYAASITTIPSLMCAPNDVKPDRQHPFSLSTVPISLMYVFGDPVLSGEWWRGARPGGRRILVAADEVFQFVH
jgi:hypothetical protein